METIERYLAPTSLKQALAGLADPGGVTVLAGGTDLMPQSHAGKLRPAHTLLNIRRVPGLDGIEVVGGRLRLGALVTLATLLTDARVHQHAPLLSGAADKFASDQIRNAATLGGNLCNASPAGDTLTPLLALDAEVELSSLAGDGTVHARWLPIAEFFTGPGRTQRAADELLTAVRMPLATPDQRARFYKGGTRPALDISTISIAFVACKDGQGRLHGVRLALGAVAPVPLRARRTEAMLEGQVLDTALCDRAAAAVAEEATPIDDVRATAWYRRELLHNITRRMLDDVAHS
jgi:CO/xanthine dehydrogenase FAD-binding subunit